MRKVLCLGASGSIGTQTLDIVAQNGDRFTLTGISVGKRIEKIKPILQAFPSISCVCVQNKADFEMLSSEIPHIHWYYGDAGLVSLIKECDCDMVVNALVGFSGLVPSVTTLEEDKILCLANKESLVVGGALIRDLLAKGKGKLYPIDSEHVAIAKLLSRVNIADVDKILITASGGSFRDKKREDLSLVTPEMALAHPTWSMGAKITIDSATMMNKGFEVLEAKWLFDFPLERTEILMHRESHVHSLLKLRDGTFLADVSTPDMHGPIAYALFETNVEFDLVRVTSLDEFKDFHFWDFDPARYPAPGLALDAFSKGGNACAVLNAANEEAVYAFLAKKLPFLCIEEVISESLGAIIHIASPTLDDLIETDRLTRAYVGEIVSKRRSAE